MFKNRLSRRWQYYIWLVVIARLLLPFAPETNLTDTLFHNIDEGLEQIEFAPTPAQPGRSRVPQDLTPDGGAAGEQDAFKSEKQDLQYETLSP